MFISYHFELSKSVLASMQEILPSRNFDTRRHVSFDLGSKNNFLLPRGLCKCANTTSTKYSLGSGEK